MATATTTPETAPRTTAQRLAALRAHARDLQTAFLAANNARSLRLSVLVADAEQHNDKIDALGAQHKGFWDTPLYLRLVAVVLNAQRDVQAYHDESVRLEEEYLLGQERMKEEERSLMRGEEGGA